MKAIIKLTFFTLLTCQAVTLHSTMYASEISLQKDQHIKHDADSLIQEKAKKSIKCLMMASMGLNNVIVDHYKDAISVFVKDPRHKEIILYQPESCAPDDYMKMMEERLFTSQIWKSMEGRLISQGEADLYTRIMYSYDSMGSLRKAGLLPSKEKWMELFIIPNFRAVYVNNMYWDSEWNGPRIEEQDIPLVISALENYIKQ